MNTRTSLMTLVGLCLNTINQTKQAIDAHTAGIMNRRELTLMLYLNSFDAPFPLSLR